MCLEEITVICVQSWHRLFTSPVSVVFITVSHTLLGFSWFLVVLVMGVSQQICSVQTADSTP